MNRALYGGSFDPIHAGHVALITMLRERDLADVVHVVPAWRSPHKARRRSGAPPAARLDLVRRACEPLPEVVVDPREIDRGGTSFTVETLAGLAAEYPEDRWRLVIGGDAAADFPRWRAPEKLLEMAELVVVARGEVSLPPLLQGRALVVGDFAHPASGTAIRADLAAGVLPGPDRLPPAVATRILEHGLYGWPGRPAAGPPAASTGPASHRDRGPTNPEETP